MLSKDISLGKVCSNIAENCSDCGTCVSECPMLQTLNDDISNIAKRQPSVEEAYSCSLCGLCEAVCPSNLSPRKMFSATRQSAVENNFIPISEYRYMFPDRKVNVMSLYRELTGITYEDCSPDQAFPVAFFPGCSMLTYSPELTRGIYSHISKEFGEVTLLADCCGLPLYQLGLRERGDNFVNSLKYKLVSLKVKKLIVACPNCYYQLRPLLAEIGIDLVTVYEALENNNLFTTPVGEKQKQLITVHDSCPDRFDNIFAEQARKALIQKGFTIVEMEHNRNTTLCCGSGGQVTHFQPVLADKLVRNRLDEVRKTGANILTAYCLGCVLNFAKIPSNLKIQHALSILLEIDQDFNGVKEKSKALFSGPQGEEYWNKIMAE